MHYTIVRPTISDSLELTKVHNQSWLETYPNDALGISREYIKDRVGNRLSEEGLKRRESAIQLSYESSSYFLRIAKDESGEIVGFIDGEIKDGHYWLDGLYTLTSTHGSGLGKELWESFLAWTHDSDVLLSVAAYNDRAIAFYKKIGFVKKAGTERLFGDTPIPIVDMLRTTTSNTLKNRSEDTL